jgi:Zn finger protein HypA/HybF involved in hydrogenase expression
MIHIFNMISLVYEKVEYTCTNQRSNLQSSFDKWQTVTCPKVTKDKRRTMGGKILHRKLIKIEQHEPH